MKEKRIVDRAGFITEYGKESMKKLNNSIDDFFMSDDIKNMTTSDIVTLGGVLLKIVSDKTSSLITSRIKANK